jgi:fructose-specific phosphotransferase system IIA component
MLLTEILTEKRIKAPLLATTKQEAIAELVDLLVAQGAIADREKALAAVLEREQTRTTGIGHRIAIPHGKTSAVSELSMAIGLASAPIDFQSIDNRPVNLVILVVSPADQTGPHIQALAHISRLLSNDLFRHKLITAPNAHEAMKLIKTQEEAER